MQLLFRNETLDDYRGQVISGHFSFYIAPPTLPRDGGIYRRRRLFSGESLDLSGMIWRTILLGYKVRLFALLCNRTSKTSQRDQCTFRCLLPCKLPSFLYCVLLFPACSVLLKATRGERCFRSPCLLHASAGSSLSFPAWLEAALSPRRPARALLPPQAAGFRSTLGACLDLVQARTRGERKQPSCI